MVWRIRKTVEVDRKCVTEVWRGKNKRKSEINYKSDANIRRNIIIHVVQNVEGHIQYTGVVSICP